MSPIGAATMSRQNLATNQGHTREILDEPLTGPPCAASVTTDTSGDDLTGGIIGY
jgi:hypothetical protein